MLLYEAGKLRAAALFWRSPSFQPRTSVNAADMVPHAATSGAPGLMGRIVGSMFAGVYMGFVVDHFGCTALT
ncbi:hypothetical protein [Selenomonas noxia]|uniref:hypothetical protein n=1 Tax=Selenomonas noxia TaxID=135083 RepID=UPI0008FBC5B6|nr:hypothetical protein [Selenomonas noxia]